jgi:hypothetical protein
MGREVLTYLDLANTASTSRSDGAYLGRGDLPPQHHQQ